MVGANENARRVVTAIEGDLNVTSLQDTSRSEAKLKSLGGGFGVGPDGMAVSFSSQRGRANGAYAGVGACVLTAQAHRQVQNGRPGRGMPMQACFCLKRTTYCRPRGGTLQKGACRCAVRGRECWSQSASARRTQLQHLPFVLIFSIFRAIDSSPIRLSSSTQNT